MHGPRKSGHFEQNFASTHNQKQLQVAHFHIQALASTEPSDSVGLLPTPSLTGECRDSGVSDRCSRYEDCDITKVRA